MDLKSLISEEVQSFLNELNDNDAVDKSNINLQTEYDKLNQQLFGGELPRIPLKWGNLKKALGRVSTLRNRATGEQTIKHLEITNFYSQSYRKFRDTLAHEMIHVKLVTNDEEDRNNAHGIPFHKEASRINSMGLGYNITQTNSEYVDVNPNKKSVDLIAIVLQLDGKYYLAVTTPKVYNYEQDAYFTGIDRMVKRGRFNEVYITIIESNNPQLQSYVIQRTLNTIKAGELPDKLLEQLLNDKIIKNEKFTRTSPPYQSTNPLSFGINSHQIGETDNNSNGNWEEFEII
jgi:hypothetical protein